MLQYYVCKIFNQPMKYNIKTVIMCSRSYDSTVQYNVQDTYYTLPLLEKNVHHELVTANVLPCD